MDEVNENQIREELEEEAEKAKRAQWVKEAKEGGKSRKARNHAIINAGVAVQKMIEDGKLDIDGFLEYVIVNKQEIVREWISNESSKR